MKQKSIWSKILKIIVPLALGVFIFWLIYRKMDWQELLNTLRTGVNYTILAASLIFGLGANIIRGLRWHLLIESVDEKPRKVHSVLTTLGTYAVNMAFPRMGEVWRCGAMSRYSRISFSKLLGTLLIDRAFDFVVVGLLVGVLLLFRFDFFANFFRSNATMPEHATNLLLSPWFYLAVVVGVGLVWLLYKLTKHHPWVKKLVAFLSDVWDGLKSVAKLEKKWLFVLQTILLWVGYFLYFYTTFFAFGFTKDLGIMAGLLAFTMSSIGIAAPVQAGIGAWHFMVITTLTTFAVSRENAYNFALIVHTVQTLWITFCGLIAIFVLPLTGQQAKKEEINHA